MILELHIIQNFAPSNLNRNDTGAPKDCIFGGSRRAWISSQCFKRAMREHFRDNFAAQNNLAERSTHLVEELASQLAEAEKDKAEAKRVVETALAGIGLKMSSKDPGKTQYLLFLGREEIKNIAQICLENYDALYAVTPPDTTEMTAKQAKQASKGSVPEVSKALQKVLDGGKRLTSHYSAECSLIYRTKIVMPRRRSRTRFRRIKPVLNLIFSRQLTI